HRFLRLLGDFALEEITLTGRGTLRLTAQLRDRGIQIVDRFQHDVVTAMNPKPELVRARYPLEGLAEFGCCGLERFLQRVFASPRLSTSPARATPRATSSCSSRSLSARTTGSSSVTSTTPQRDASRTSASSARRLRAKSSRSRAVSPRPATSLYFSMRRIS